MRKRQTFFGLPTIFFKFHIVTTRILPKWMFLCDRDYIFVIEKRRDIKIQSSAPLKFLKIDNTVSYQPLRF